jgi:hypothetical protein
LLNSPTSTFFCHKLNVDIFPGPYADQPEGVNSIFDTISHHLFRLKIKSLSLSCSEWDISGETQEEIFEYFATIPALNLQDVIFSVPTQFITFLKSFLSLESLHLRNITFNHNSTHTTPFTLSPLLRGVDLVNHYWDHSTIPWFLSAVQFPPLKYLGIYYIEGDYMDVVQAVLQSLGPSLHELHLRFVDPSVFILCWCSSPTFDCDSGDSGDGDLLDLSHNVSLRHLGVEGLNGETLLDILSQITSFDLETIYVQVDFGAVEMVKWNEIVQILTRDQFVKLQKVYLDVICHGYYLHDCSGPGWVDHIRQQMPILGDVLDVSVFHFE